MDFVLWKPSKPGEPAWPSPAGIAAPGRPGWHIECSAMAEKHLGQMFDIHGGGIDLVFPHHENEVAQSRCAHGTPVMANVWMHNGFLQVEGEKMSKSLGNFVTIRELLTQWPGDTVRLNMLRTHYRQPIDWTIASLESARAELFQWSDLVSDHFHELEDLASVEGEIDHAVLEALSDDLNTPAALSAVQALLQRTAKGDVPPVDLTRTLLFLGFRHLNKPGFFHPGFVANLYESGPQIAQGSSEHIEILRFRAETANGMVQSAGSIKGKLEDDGFIVKINDAGVLFVGNKTGGELEKDSRARIDRLIEARNAARKAKDFKQADRIRDELSAMGIQLKDAKDPATGEIVTTWEVKR